MNKHNSRPGTIGGVEFTAEFQAFGVRRWETCVGRTFVEAATGSA